ALGFLDLFGGSIGAQLGAKATDLIVLFKSDDARSRLESGRMTLGADASVAFGSSDSSANVGTNRADVEVYSSSRGLFAGASFDGVVIAADEDELKEFYKENAAYRRIITTYNAPNHPLVVRDFIKLMSQEELEEQEADS